ADVHVGDDHGFTLVQNTGEGHYAGRKARSAKGPSIARYRAKILASVTERRVLRADPRDVAQHEVELVRLVKGIWPSPQRFADVLVRGPGAVEALLRPVIDAGNPLQRKQAGKGRRDLPVVAAGIGGIDKAEAVVLVVVVEKGDAKAVDV